MLCSLLAYLPGDDPSKDEARLLLDTIESLQQPVEDFQCEFEGQTYHLVKEVAEQQKLGKDGLAESFSGSFAWRRGGDFRYDRLKRDLTLGGKIMRQAAVVRMQESRAELYMRMNDEPNGAARVLHPRQLLASWDLHSPRDMFLIDELRYDVNNETHLASVADDRISGRSVKVLKIGFKINNVTFRSYWIDLSHGGHVVRAEFYGFKDPTKPSARRDITLASFKVGDAVMWMPVSAEQANYVTETLKEPGVREKLYVVNGTMQFNTHPGPEVFTMKYKPGTPISDSLRKLQYEYGQEKIREEPTRAEVEKMLKDQLAEAEKQKSTLVVAQTSAGSGWYAWLPWGFAALVVISLAALWIQRRGR
ncbi:MAG: hypothetical protein ACP5XB_31595 [Isosphaeraceae bacterium]